MRVKLRKAASKAAVAVVADNEMESGRAVEFLGGQRDKRSG